MITGQRYGLLGRNGCGKSTILRLLAEQPCRIRGVPAGLDTLLVEQESSSSDVSIVQQVLAADTERTDLLQEEHSLWLTLGGEACPKNIYIPNTSKPCFFTMKIAKTCNFEVL